MTMLSRPATTLLRFLKPMESRALAHSLPASFIKINKWNRAVVDAEKLVGYPTSYMSLRALMNDDITNMAVHLRKLIGSDHPVLKAAKRLLYHGKNNMQIRGLLVLLLSRAAGAPGNPDLDPTTGVLPGQRKLAEIVEMIHSAQSIHQSVVNIPVNVGAEPDEQVRSVLGQLEYGNKISILSGDYLLANACTALASLRITKIVELVSVAIIEFTQAEFLGKMDPQGRMIPTSEVLNQESWEEKWKLSSGGLLGAGCESAMLAAQQTESFQKAAKSLGVHTALAIQAYDEILTFSPESGLGAGAPFSLLSAPVIFHLQQDTELLDYISQYQEDLLQIDYKKVLDRVQDGPGIQRTRDLVKQHVDISLQHLKEFPDNDGRMHYENILKALL